MCLSLVEIVVNDGIHITKMSRHIHAEFSGKVFTTSTLLVTVRSLCSFMSHSKIPAGLIKKAFEFSKTVEYNAIKILPLKVND